MNHDDGPADFVRFLGTPGNLKITIVAGGKHKVWRLTDEMFFNALESGAEKAAAVSKSRRLVAVERPAFAEELQPPCDT